MSIFEPWAGQRVGQFNPEFASSLVGKIQARNRRQSFDEAHDNAKTTENATVANRTTPTPENTGAPMPKATSTTPKLPVKSTRAYPKMNKKQTAPGTKPKKK